MSTDFRMRTNGAGVADSESHRRNRNLLFGTREAVNYVPQSAGASQEQEMLEAENQQRVDHLGNKVGALKSIAITINEEVEYDNKILLEGMSRQFEGAGDILSQTMKKLDDMVKDGRSNQLCYLVLGILVVFFLAYFLLHRR